MVSTRLHPNALAEALLNRKLSWLDLNGRVLELAADPNEPLLERVKFCGIFSSNLDEFFMVRVAGLIDQVVSGVSVRSRDGRTSQNLCLDQVGDLVEEELRPLGPEVFADRRRITMSVIRTETRRRPPYGGSRIRRS